MPGVLHPPRPDYVRVMRKPSTFAHRDSYRPPYEGAGLGMRRPKRGIGYITMPAQASVADGDRITVDDGAVLVTYEMDTLGNGCTFPGAICVDLSTCVTAEDCRAALSVALQFNSHVLILDETGGTIKMGTAVIKNNGGLATTGANITVLGFICASYGSDVIPIRWGLSRGVFGGGGLTS